VSRERGAFVIYVVAALIVVSIVQSWLLWRFVRLMGHIGRFDDRLSRCAQGLSLLVDTSEAGFAMLGSELGKLTAAPQPQASSKSTTRRIVAAARRGREVPDIAAREGLAEGEVRLRMHMADVIPADVHPRSGEGCGTLRAS
jgi:hypothetical protein